MWDIEDFMEDYYGYRPAEMITLEEFEEWKKDNDCKERDYSLYEYEHIAENGIECEPVRFSELYGGYDYRFCEIPEVKRGYEYEE